MSGRSYIEGLGDPLFAVEVTETEPGRPPRIYAQGPYRSIGAARSRRTQTLSTASHRKKYQLGSDQKKTTARVFWVESPNWEEVLD